MEVVRPLPEATTATITPPIIAITTTAPIPMISISHGPKKTTLFTISLTGHNDRSRRLSRRCVAGLYQPPPPPPPPPPPDDPPPPPPLLDPGAVDADDKAPVNDPLNDEAKEDAPSVPHATP